MRGNRRKIPPLSETENPVVRRWYRENQTLLREAYHCAQRYAKHPLPQAVEKKLETRVLACMKTGQAVKPAELCQIVKECSLREGEIAELPDGLTAALLKMSAEERDSEAAIQTVCRSLMMLESLEHRLLFEAGRMHRILMADPAGVYPQMHPRSQGEYRAILAKLARKARISETEAAERILRLASAGKSERMRHIGYWILERPLGNNGKSRRNLFYSAVQLALGFGTTTLLCVRNGFLWSAAFPAFLIFAGCAVQTLTSRRISRRPLPRMKEVKTPTLCVIVALVSKAEQVTELMEKMEDYLLTAGSPAISVALLADFAESKTAISEKDKELRILLADTVKQLNAKYGSAECGERFYLFLRERQFSESDGIWRGWERKRGAILELCALIEGKPSQILPICGNENNLRTFSYLIVLDEDSRPQVGALEELTAAAEHPLNQPILSADGLRVAEGYGILNPNLKTAFPPDGATDFALLYGGTAGFSRYSASAGHRQFDLTGTVPFTGKGLIHVEAFERLMRNRFPENAILSHDLPEGEIMRTGFCAAAQISDGFPQTRDTYEKRRHRWIRGDVQNLRLLGEAGSIRILANVFADLYDVADMELALLAAWLDPRFLWVLGLSIFTPLFSELHRIEGLLRNGCQRSFYPRSDSFSMSLKRCFDRLFHLPFSTAVALDAAVRAGVRMLFTHRGLLEWSTAAQGGDPIKAGRIGMMAGILIGIFSGTPAGLILAGCWTAGLFSDLRERYAYNSVSRETGTAEQKPSVSRETGTAEQKPSVSRETGIAEQEPSVSRETGTAEQKSSVSRETGTAEQKPSVSRETGITEQEPSVSRETGTAEQESSVSRETGTAEQKPSVSRETGTAEQKPSVSRETGIAEQKPSVSRETGIAEQKPSVSRETGTAEQKPSVSRETLTQKQRNAEALRSLLRDSLNYYLAYCTEERHFLPPDNVQSQPEARIAERTSPTNVGLAMLSLYAGWELHLIDGNEALRLLYGMTENLEQWPKWKGHPCNWVDTQSLHALTPTWISTVDSGNLAVCLAALVQGELPEDLRERVRCILENMDFTALYDEEKRLFRLGFHLERNEMAESCYDLANSEARLASYWAIASGQVGAEHWESLRRPIRKADGFAGLASWSGTMFETALPLLFLPCPKGGIWWETMAYLCREQRKAARDGLWGMSESGYFAFDEELNYQYKAHGVQAAAVKEEAQEEVFAPYAAAMALPFVPEEALQALEAYKRYGLRDSMGFCEAIDWERGKIPIRSHMAHHQGMTILAVWKLLNGGAERLCRKDARLRAFLPLLAEELPQNCRALPPKQQRKQAKQKKEPTWIWQSSLIDAENPRLTILGNPAYRVFITDTGRSTSISKGRTVAGLDFEEHFEAWLDEIPLYPHDWKGTSYSCTLSSSSAIHRMKTEQWRSRIETRVSAEVQAEQRWIHIQNRAITSAVKYR